MVSASRSKESDPAPGVGLQDPPPFPSKSTRDILTQEPVILDNQRGQCLERIAHRRAPPVSKRENDAIVPVSRGQGQDPNSYEASGSFPCLSLALAVFSGETSIPAPDRFVEKFLAASTKRALFCGLGEPFRTATASTNLSSDDRICSQSGERDRATS
jgi:hypothetical protein